MAVRGGYIATVMVLMMVTLLFNSRATAQVTCGMVVTNVAPCINYLRSGVGNVPVTCCDGVRNLNSVANTPSSRRVACQCLKTAASSITDIKAAVAASLPGKCGVNIPYKISPTTDCSKVN